ncbi:MAG: adenylate/guanylate cyclase domain-containing protein [Acidobacteria bacterium]|nr:MAG: adenylate/guanylate cyclase domain-containing protein [Acidobacteriota bacterium]
MSDFNLLLDVLIRATMKVSRGCYDDASELFELTQTGRYPDAITQLAEAFGMMMVQVEAREMHLSELIQTLESKNQQLEAHLQRIRLLEKIQVDLGHFVPSAVRRLVATNPEGVSLDKEERDVSVLFLDVVGYTRLCESLGKDKMNSLIESLFSTLVDDIVQNDGDINETAGDSLMVIFQNPEPVQHACNASRAALAMQRKVEKLEPEAVGLPAPLEVRIGINSGPVLLGTSRFDGLTGSRWTYTASGSTTNIAARIAALSPGNCVLCGPDTARRVQPRFCLQSIGIQPLKNVAEPVEIFRVCAESAGEKREEGPQGPQRPQGQARS